MDGSRFVRRPINLVLLVSLILTLSFTVQAQGEVTISLAIPAYNEEVYEDAVEEFEALNPGIRVHIEDAEYGVPFFYAGDVDNYLNTVAEYVETADVLLVNSELAPEATRAGYFLDMSPLVNTDATLNPNDFYPALWDSYHWDGGIWGLPVAGDVVGIFYQQAVFDEAGLAYPNENWTVADFNVAAQALAQFDDDGEIVVPGFFNGGGGLNSFGMFLISMLGDDVVDDSVIPNIPDFSNPELQSLMLEWMAIADTGVMDFPQGGYTSNELPFVIGPSFFGIGFNNEAVSVAPFPGGGIGINPQGFAISAGTQNPELAYELIKFLVSSPIVTDSFFTEVPALRSLTEMESDDDDFLIGNEMSPELEAFIQRGLEEGISLNEARFSRYLSEAILPFGLADVNVQDDLSELEDLATERLAIADERAETVDFTVIPAPPPPQLASGEGMLSFQMTAFFNPLPNESEWQTFVDEFVANEPGIGFVEFDEGFPSDINVMINEVDCFYLPFTAMQLLDTTQLISLDPLMSADSTVDMNDFLPNAVSLVSENGLIWGFPITLQPLMLNYDAQMFADAGVPEPQNGWSIDEFELALQEIDALLGEDEFVFESREFGNIYLLSLIAAYGGLPVDTRTTPTTYNYTDPDNVEAIQQVLNLITDGYIAYNPLNSFGGSGTQQDIPMYAQSFTGSQFAFSSPFEDSYQYVTFPTGSQYSAMNFTVGAGYITGNSQNIEACYRFISEMASRPELFYSMPARQSLVNTPELAAAQSQDAVDFYSDLADLMLQPNTIILSSTSSTSQFVESYWLNRVFDQYVAGEIMDLAQALAEAEQFTLAFQECAVGIPAFEEGVDDPSAYFARFTDCAELIDPASAEFFDF